MRPRFYCRSSIPYLNRKAAVWGWTNLEHTVFPGSCFIRAPKAWPPYHRPSVRGIDMCFWYIYTPPRKEEADRDTDLPRKKRAACFFFFFSAHIIWSSVDPGYISFFPFIFFGPQKRVLSIFWGTAKSKGKKEALGCSLFHFFNRRRFMTENQFPQFDLTICQNPNRRIFKK